MPPLKLEVLVPGRGTVEMGRINPGYPIGSISNNREDGVREMYLFETDGSKGIIYRSNKRLDSEIAFGVREVDPIADRIEVIRGLLAGETHEMEVKPDKFPLRVKVRFTQE